MNILEILQHYIRHQEDVVTRRTKYDLNKAEAVSYTHLKETYTYLILPVNFTA